MLQKLFDESGEEAKTIEKIKAEKLVFVGGRLLLSEKVAGTRLRRSYILKGNDNVWFIREDSLDKEGFGSSFPYFLSGKAQEFLNVLEKEVKDDDT